MFLYKSLKQRDEEEDVQVGPARLCFYCSFSQRMKPLVQVSRLCLRGS